MMSEYFWYDLFDVDRIDEIKKNKNTYLYTHYNNILENKSQPFSTRFR